MDEKKINRDFIKGWWGGGRGTIFEVISQKKSFFFMNDVFPKCYAWLSVYSWKGWGLYTCQKYVTTPKCLAQISGENWKCWVLYTSYKYVSTPQIFGTNIRIELKMLGFVHILEICFHPTNVWHESWDRIENFGFYTHPINMFDDQSPICI